VLWIRQHHGAAMIDLTPLYQAVLDQFVLIVPVLGGIAIAWLARRGALIRAVKAEAIDAERRYPDKGAGAVKKAHVAKVIKRTWPMSRLKDIDQAIEAHGMPAVKAVRESQRPTR
jgi:hypothetical protein